MNRRKFISASAAAGVSLSSALQSAPGNRPPESATENTMVDQQSFIDDFELNELTIDQLQKGMQDGKFTARSITELYLRRIETIDKHGQLLNAVIELNPEAFDIADAMDRERKSGKVRGLLHGIPMLVKDNIDTCDRMMTTAGSLALKGHRAERDAFIITKLREAGAVLLGKTNLSEWANFRSKRSTSGWSSRGGQTRNPYELNRNPSGSSSGSAVAVSANLCAVAIGTETDGSIIAPASCCGIVGLKPTVGLLSRSGIIPISQTQDTPGPMTRTVRDAAILLSVLAGVDRTDATTRESKGKAEADYTKHLLAGSLKGRRIGVEKSQLQGHEDVVALYKQAVEVLRNLGASITEVELLKETWKFGKAETTVLQFEFKEGLNRYLSGANGTVKSLADVIEFNKNHAAQTMPYFKQDTLQDSNGRAGLDSKTYTEALAKTLSLRVIISDLMKAEKLDCICGVSMSPAGYTDFIYGDYESGFYFCQPAAMAGYPHITVPMGSIMNLPVGLSFMSTAYKEAEILSFAYSYEQETKKRVKPKFL